MRAGDFSAWSRGGVGVHDPLTNGGYFPNNVIPVSRFDPAAEKMVKLFPLQQLEVPGELGVPAQITSDDQEWRA
jgi:hypothetical protein